MANIYLIGSLRNPRIPEIGQILRNDGHYVFDDWHAGGPQADDEWKRYELERQRTYQDALDGWVAHHIFEFDLVHLNRCDIGVVVMPAGRSAHLEIGYLLGKGKRGFVLFEQDPERWDIMYKFCTGVCFGVGELLVALNEPL